MAISPLGNEFKGLTFDGVSSKTYGVQILGKGVFNAPKRDVQMITIPGRNGDYALDKGRFENVTVTYPANLIADNTEDFAKAISDFRNQLCSREGYCRLEDDYHTDEYRLAVYKSGLEVTESVLKAGEFNIVFECKPQRFLTSGETAVEVESGDTLTNPTLFEARPLLEVWGSGDLLLGDSEITVSGNAVIGNVIVHQDGTVWQKSQYAFTIDTTYANNGDALYLSLAKANAVFYSTNDTIVGVAVTSSGDFDITNYWTAGTVTVNASAVDKQFAYGTALTLTSSVSCVVSLQNAGNVTVTISWTLAYDGDDTFTFTKATTVPTQITEQSSIFLAPYFRLGDITLNSSQYALGNPMYIDLDLGEAYKIEDGSVVSVNNAVQMSAALPTLKPGNNEITFDNTFTEVKVVPRWWKI